MDRALREETERLTWAWDRYPQEVLDNYLTVGVEDPRINVQSILTRSLVTRVLFPGEFEGLLDAELPEQGHDVIREVLKRHLSVDVRGMAVALHLDRDDPVALSEGRDHGSEGQTDRERTSVQEHERRAAAVNLVVHLQPVNGRVRWRRHESRVRRTRRLRGQSTKLVAARLLLRAPMQAPSARRMTRPPWTRLRRPS